MQMWLGSMLNFIKKLKRFEMFNENLKSTILIYFKISMHN